MPLPIRDGNQSLTTLSTIVVSNAHIPAHTVVSLGTQAITDIATAVSGVELGPNTINALENITVTLGQVTITGGLTDAQLRASAVTIGGSVTATISGIPSVTFSEASVTFGTAVVTGSTSILNFPATQTVTFTQASVTFGTAVITGSTSIIGTPSVTFTQIATHGVTIGSGTAQIGSVTASISGTPSVTFTTATITGSVSILNFPATQTVTFSQAPVTFGLISGTVTVNSSANFDVRVTQGGDPVDDDNPFPIDGTVTIGAGTAQIGSVTVGNTVSVTGGLTDTQLRASPVNIAGTVTANLYQAFVNVGECGALEDGDGSIFGLERNFPVDIMSSIPTGTNNIGGVVVLNFPATQPVSIASVTIGSALPAGTNRIGVVTIGGGTVTIGAGTSQIGSVTASINGTVPISISSVTVGNSVTIGSLPAISGTVTANVPNIQVCTQGVFAQTSAIQTAIGVINTNNNSQVLAVYGSEVVEEEGISAFVQVRNQISGTVTANNVIFNDVSGFQSAVQAISDIELNAIRSAIWIADSSGSNGFATEGQILSQNYPMPIAGTVTANVDNGNLLFVGGVRDGDGNTFGLERDFPISGTVTVGSLPAVSGTVTIGAGTAQIGSVTASNLTSALLAYSGGNSDFSVNIRSVGGQAFGQGQTWVPVAIAEGSLPTGTNRIGVVTIGNTVTIANIQGTAVTTSNFTSLTPSTVLAGFNATREVLTVFNEGAGNLHISVGTTCTTQAYQVRLSAGDYYEAPLNQASITHSAVFATAGTARVTQVS